MKVIVIYDSVFGNTRQIAEAIADGLGVKAEVKLISIKENSNPNISGDELLVIGSPTRGFRPTEEIGKYLKEINSQTIPNINYATFDTRFKEEEVSRFVRFVIKTGGYAAVRMHKVLRDKGAQPVTEPIGFYVKTENGPLREGEIERAREWGKSLV